jgi:MerR family transcriptional regulator, heat shock protein HspR
MADERSSGCTPETPNGYYTIGEAADILEVSIPTIRMYEREGLIIPYRKNSRHRRFSSFDIERVRCMRTMINKEKVSIAGIRRLLALVPCWKIKNCPEDARNACSAYNQVNAACWMASNKAWNCRSADCRQCEVYTTIGDCQTLKATIAKFTLEPTPGLQS